MNKLKIGVSYFLVAFIIIGLNSCGSGGPQISNGDRPVTADKPNPAAEKMPDIKFLNLDSTAVSRKDLKKQTTVMFFFNTTCNHCQKNARHLVDNADKLKDTQVILFSSEPMKALKHFNEVYDIDKYDNFTIMQVEDKKIFDWFGEVQVPSTFIYNRHHEVVKKIIGNTMFDFILDSLPS